MIEWLLQLYTTPESQPDAYTWAAVFLAHMMIGVGLRVLTSWTPVLKERPTFYASLGYLVFWEYGQLLITGAITNSKLADAHLDAIAVTLGAILAASAWTQNGRRLGAVLMAGLLILFTGVQKRR